jgi:hypothetical protein
MALRKSIIFASLALLGCGQSEGDHEHAGDPTSVPAAVERAEQQADEARDNAAASDSDEQEIPSAFDPMG